MFLAEFQREIISCISFIDNDALLLILTKINIYEEKWRIGIIEVFLVALTFINLFLYFLLLFICIDLA